MAHADAALRAHAAQNDPAQLRKRPSIPTGQLKFLTPLLWAPAVPLIRIGMGHPRLQHARPYAVAVCIVAANLHAFFLISNPDLSDEALGR
ncbi:hypothetical protein AB1Y20_000345 [Prymnesium parvum]|uniref:Uncharacterized protein n=1 Tax=Prymnesium parvum TaxID=97485 RepID=A0AB34K549_PRYPA